MKMKFCGEFAAVLTVAIALVLMRDLCAPAAVHAEAPKAADVQIEIDGISLTVQGKKLSIPFELAELTEVLGQDDRVTKLANWISTWDDLGVVAYCRPETTEVHSVAVFFVKKDFKFSPQSTYRGKFTLDGAVVSSESTVSGINLAKKGKALKELRTLWGIEEPTILIGVHMLQDAENKPQKIEDVSISERKPKVK